MLVTKDYDRDRALAYARRWALSRNPLYFDYTGIGGNCTNFVSQCIYAGSCTMNYTPVFGWYYLSPGERTASWTGVNFFYNFLTGNENIGPFGREIGREELLPGDVIQLSRERGGYYHSLLVLEKSADEILVAAQSNDVLDRPLSTYQYDSLRYLHIDGVRITVPDTGDCFESLLNGVAIIPNEASIPRMAENGGGSTEFPPTPPEDLPPAEENAPVPEAPSAEEIPPAPEATPNGTDEA